MSRDVLLIEDDANFRRSVKVLFKDRTYRFDEASTPEEGIGKLASNPDIRVILLDLRFPGDGAAGVSVLRYVQPRATAYRVIVLTAHNSLPAEQAEAYSVFMYLPKAGEGSSEAIRFAVDHAFADLERAAQGDGSHQKASVFLSYATADRERVAEVYDELASRGFRPWMDYKDIRPGMKWEAEIRNAIAAADFFLFFVSPTSTLGDGLFLAELQRAFDRQSTLPNDAVFTIAVRLEDCAVGPPLNEYQHVDLFRPAGMSRLVKALSRR